MTERRAPDLLTLRFWLGIAALVILSSVGALAAIVSVARTTLGLDATVISSGSMEPSISPGDVVLLRTEVGEPTVGAVVRFAGSEGDTIVHRVREVRPEGYVTKGDANRSADSGVRSHADLLGVGVVVVPGIGMPLLWWAEGDTTSMSVALITMVLAAWLVASGALAIDPWATAAAGAPSEPLTGRRVRAAGRGPAAGLVGAELADALVRAGVPRPRPRAGSAP
jgi:signal peptidase